jgi:hypothetical protein
MNSLSGVFVSVVILKSTALDPQMRALAKSSPTVSPKSADTAHASRLRELRNAFLFSFHEDGYLSNRDPRWDPWHGVGFVLNL